MCSDFSRSLTLLRKEKGISQRSAAKDLGISQALLSHYENGIREPGLAFVVKACDYYGVSADYLLGRTLSRDGTTIVDAESLYDYSAEKDNVLRGSIMATLSKKLLVNSVGILFDLLGKVGSKEAIKACSDYLGTALYKMFRYLYRADGTCTAVYHRHRHHRYDLCRGGLCGRAGRPGEGVGQPSAHQPRCADADLSGRLPISPADRPQYRRADHPPPDRLSHRKQVGLDFPHGDIYS